MEAIATQAGYENRLEDYQSYDEGDVEERTV
jgi:hypothetical protein